MKWPLNNHDNLLEDQFYCLYYWFLTLDFNMTCLSYLKVGMLDTGSMVGERDKFNWVLDKHREGNMQN
jgi:hypothetical protein